MNKRVLGEASRQEGSLVEQIKAKAFDGWVEDDDGLEEHVQLVKLDDVLVLVQKDRTEHNKKLQQIKDEADSHPKWSERGMGCRVKTPWGMVSDLIEELSKS